jgi:GNAT superfamily N-acetyltransferase
MAMNAARRQRTTADPDRSELVQLADGRELLIRPIRPEDSAPIAAAFELLNEDEIRKRFLHALKALGEEHLRRLTNPAPGAEFAVVAAEALPAGEALVSAVARLSRNDDDPTRAEFGLLVSHFVVGLGLGRLLLQRLIDWSARHGVQQLWGDVMDDNTPMLDLATHLGFHREAMRGSPGLIRISLQVPAAKLRG